MPRTHQKSACHTVKYQICRAINRGILNNIERDTFNYADYFPDSNKLHIFGTARRGATVKNYLDNYVSICQKRNLSPSTIEGCKKCTSALKNLHKVYIAKLTPAIIKNWIEQQNASLKTTRNRYSFLKSSLEDAVIDGLLASNPAIHVSVSRYHNAESGQSGHYLVDPFSPDEVSLILASCANQQWENLFMFDFATGMRPSELCAAKWENVDFINKRYFVDAARIVGVEK